MFDKKKFREVLRIARGKRDNQQYADESGVSRTYISNYMNLKRESPPSVEVLKMLASAAHNGVSFQDFMVAAGYIQAPTPEKNTSDSQRVFSEFFEAINMVKIPLLGRIPAGMPIEVIENVEAWISVPEDLVSDGDYFYLRVEGDSMIGSRICDGDRVLVRKQSYVDSGEIAVVRVNSHDATLKRVKKINGQVILYPDNPSYEPIIVKEEEAEIIGKVVRVEFEPKRK